MQKENVGKRILHCKGRRKKDFKVGTKNVAALLVVKKMIFLSGKSRPEGSINCLDILSPNLC